MYILDTSKVGSEPRWYNRITHIFWRPAKCVFQWSTVWWRVCAHTIPSWRELTRIRSISRGRSRTSWRWVIKKRLRWGRSARKLRTEWSCYWVQIVFIKNATQSSWNADIDYLYLQVMAGFPSEYKYLPAAMKKFKEIGRRQEPATEDEQRFKNDNVCLTTISCLLMQQ